MANWKRKKSKRSVRCVLCTAHSWRGNHAGRHDFKTEADKFDAQDEIREYSDKNPRLKKAV